MTEQPMSFQALAKKISSSLSKGTYQEALVALRNYEATHPNDRNLCYNKHAVLIDIGFGLRDFRVVQEGVESGEQLLQDQSYQNRAANIKYNLANGYSCLHKLAKPDELAAIPQSENLQVAKSYYRHSLVVVSETALELKKQILVNLANCYNMLGRGVEAIDLYEEALEIDPAFSMATANRAVALKYFADISGEYRASIYIEAYQAIKAILENSDLLEIGGYEARTALQAELKNIESKFEDPGVLSQNIAYPKYGDSRFSKFEKFYVEYCIQERLFLNFHIHQRHSRAAIIDPIFISMITPVDDNVRFYDLAKRINQIKENFVVARLILVESQYGKKAYDNISKRTTYVDSLDYSRFDIYGGLLKSAYELSYNVLDKIGCFINDYCELGVKEEKVHFTSIWQEGNQMRNKLLNTKNVSLYALYDIYRDFKSGYNEQIRQIRHALTHRRLIVYDLLRPGQQLDPSYEILYDSLVEQTTKLMRLTRAAIIYLINFVNENEKKKVKDKEVVVPFQVFTM